jgi:hypothetical protein
VTIGYTSGDDSESGAKAHDPNAKHLKNCNICTKTSSVKSVLCMICCKYVSREELEAGICHSKVILVNTPCVSSRDTTAGVGITSTKDMTGYREIRGDVLCKPVSREERRYRNIMVENAKIRR